MPTPRIAVWNIVGTSPLIQGNPEQMWAEPEPEEEGATTPRKKRPMYAGQSESFKTAATTLYRNDQNEFWHPGQAFFQSLMLGCRERKLGSKKAIDVVTIAVSIVEQEFLLYDPKTLAAKKKPKMLGPKDWLVDKRRALNHNKKPAAGVVAIRAKWPVWGGLLAIEVDCDVFKQDKKGVPELGGLTELLSIAGVAFGIGVGRRRINAVDRWGKEQWSDMGMGRFKAELRE